MRRRDMLGLLAATCGAPGLVSAAARDAAAAGHADGRRLILVELAGANDGLNTLVPWRSDDYRRLRPTLALGKDDVIPLHGDMAVHKKLAPLMPTAEAGELAFVQGLGYPRPNRSHFQSIALWERAGDGHGVKRREGWMTHAIEHRLGQRRPDVDGMSLDGGMSLFASESGRWLSAASVAQLLDGAEALSVTQTIDNAIVSRIADRFAKLDRTLAGLHAKLLDAPEVPDFETGALGDQLRRVVRFIGAGLDVPVYRVRLAGFDTHENQRNRHARLLHELATSLATFRTRLVAMGEWQSTVVMTYSEFGRRAAENASGGTDHGTAAPHLVLGGRVLGGREGGLYGDAPDLADSALIDGDPVHTLDYRALYSRVLSGALGATDELLASHDDRRLAGLIV